MSKRIHCDVCEGIVERPDDSFLTAFGLMFSGAFWNKERGKHDLCLRCLMNHLEQLVENYNSDSK